MIDTMPMQQLQLLMQKQQQEPTNSDVGSLSPPLLPKSNDDDKIKGASRPWRLTPPLKKRRVRISLDDDDQNDSNPMMISPLPKKTATLKIPVKLAAFKAKKTVTKSTQKKKAVRFSRVIKTRTLKKERTLASPQEQSAMWYQNREYAEIDQECLKNVQAMHQVQGDLAQLPADDYCLRGLEMKTSPHIHRLRRLRASITVRAVLDQQAYMRRMGATSDDLLGESMAIVSRLYTQQAKNRARELGLIDSIEASRIR